MRVFNDILFATDSRDFVILVSLELAAAFDTVDHDTLSSCLQRYEGIQGTVLEWFRSYLA